MSPPSSPHKPPNRGSAKPTHARSKTIDIGDSLGPYDTNTVREKIRKWQTQGGGVVIAPDVGAGSDEEKGPPEPKPQKTKSQEPKQGEPKPREPKPHESRRRTRTRQRREATKPRHEAEEQNVLSSSTPKKRVISDGHWRKARSPPNSVSTTSSPRKRAEVSNKSYDQARSRFEGKEDATPQTASKLDVGDGIKVYAGPLRASRSKSPGFREDSGDPDEKSLESHKLADPIVEDKKKNRSSPRRRSSKDDLKRHKQSRPGNAKFNENTTKHNEKDRTTRRNGLPDFPTQDDHRPSPGRPDGHSVPRAPAKGGIFNQVIDGSKKMFSKPEPEPEQVATERVHGSRVEAWLSATADPFVDEEEPPVEIPAPLNSTSPCPAQSKSEENDSVHLPRHSEEVTEDVRPKRSKKPQKARESSRAEKITRKDEPLPKPRRARSRGREGSPDSESSGLRRSGARKRPNSTHDSSKMSNLRESVDEALQQSSLDGPYSSDESSEASYMDRPPPLTLRRPFPGTGAHRLSTIASVDTLTTSNGPVPHRSGANRRAPTVSESKSTALPESRDKRLTSESRDQFDPDSLPGPATTSLKRQLTTHADLMSVLSLPVGRSRSIRSARSIRTNRSRLATATVGDLMRELASDESKYMRELRTLVGGVIPVLLTSVLSKTDSAVAAGLFRRSANPKDDANFTRPIIDMGVSLERLKALHKRIPLEKPDALLNWAQGAQKVYADYLKAWRLGFQDVVVNLAPPDDDDDPTTNDSDAKSVWGGMSQDENGDVVDGDGERVDVAFLLKRPLVRLKYLAKTFKGINYVQNSPKTEELSVIYQSLVADARRRSNEERSRLEDDAAAAIDATRCRDLQTLGVLEDVTVDQTRRVRARDFFDLSILHSTGQQIDCSCELLLRDNPSEKGPGGDLFISEADDGGRWLLFPPIDYGRVSARRGDGKGEIVIMIRESLGDSEKWHELLSLKTEEEQLSYEWVELLGTSPVPPKINRSLSFLHRIKGQKSAEPSEPQSPLFRTPTTDRVPTPTEISIPIGEQASAVTRRRRPTNRASNERDDEPSLPQSTSAGRSGKIDTKTKSPRTPTRSQESTNPRSLNEAMKLAGGGSPTALKRTKAQRKSKQEPLSPSDTASPAGDGTPDRYYQQLPEAPESARSIESGLEKPKSEVSSRQPDRKEKLPEKRPIADVVKPQGRRRSLSPVPSMELPVIPRVRKRDPNATPPLSPTSSAVSDRQTPRERRPKEKQDNYWPTDDELPFTSSAVSDHQTPRERRPKEKQDNYWPTDEELPFTEDVPPPPPHRTPVSPSPKSKQSDPPVLSPPTPQYSSHRRTSSPLKREYEPSTATESSLSETSTVEHHDVYSSSETSDDELEGEDIATPLPPIGSQRAKKASPPTSPPTVPVDTLAPSNSASQAPYKTVPAQPSKASKAAASIYYWHDKGSWEFLHSGECRIIVTPGLIEAYEMSAVDKERPGSSSDSDQSYSGKRPLIALELTPLVPIRRGTALDITIRSPPTERSRITLGNNIMFRSQNPDECDKLYGLINHSRINNPTYIALQNARGPYSSQPTPPGRPNSNRSGRLGGLFSWYGGSSKSSYRVSSAPTPSLGASESSVGTMASAFSALKKFGAGSKMFSIARSTLTSRTGSRAGSLYTTSTGSGSNSSPGSKPIDASKASAGGIGLTNAKIRLYSRESASKWRDMGPARITILPVSPRPSRPGTSSNSNKEFTTDQPTADNDEARNEEVYTSSSAAPPLAPPPLQNMSKPEKRILIRGKKHGEVLLDACLGESCFERVARTGIAVSVWDEFDQVAKQGGVVGGSFRIYMLQMKSEAETAYTFGLVGKLRY